MKKRWKLISTGICMVLTLMAGRVFCDEMYVYPAKGQNQQQIDKDKNECFLWAKQQTGFDPAAQAPPQQTQAGAGGGVHGAARGALLGVAIGAIAGDAGKGAAIGAASGGLIGGMRQRDQNAQQQAAQQNQAANYDQQRHNFNRAYQGCLEGRGYSVK
ncbi:glycine zipper domain-containing protein [Desulfosarcina sp.]|uniref:glycine zipper domain-containing protein n=1 Tax=Desulfosarcina sp. TaxID=2027861 RepID=UPI0029A94103|nr:glycine zipper domain-containing protein [Desulfosarcina sp.]MDX2492975.1 glycine zipper domain-containing protein [Desulfosarcina sp.]